MKPLLLKRSTSRKSIHKLCVRQQKRIINEIRNNLQSNNNVENCVTQSDAIAQDTLNPLHTKCSSSTDNIENNACNILPLTNVQSDNFASSDNDAAPFSNTFSTEPLFKQKLASCFIENNFSHVQGNSILSLLRTHSCFQNLPKDTRTLLNTPRNKVILSKIEPGEYIHLDLETEIIEALLQLSLVSLPNYIELDFHIDGCALDKLGSVHLWPIQCRFVNIKYTKPIVVGIYKGPTKPNDPNLFFEQFITDIKKILLKGGITISGKKLPIRLRCFIADAPARSFILNHRSHTSSQPCSKCKVSGIRCEGRYIFPGVSHTLRTNKEYETCVDEDHHKDGKSPLSMLPIGMVSHVPFEYMHLVCLGAMKKLFSAWIRGKYSRSSKLSAWSISVMSKRLEALIKYCPSDFARRPRSLDACTKYKATEYRQFLLYTGPVVTYGLLNQQVYTHFLFLHAAIRILVSASPSKTHLKFADLALQKFVKRCEIVYGATFLSYNIHCLIHLANDVQQLGPLDTFSAFPYENHMRLFRKYCRKPDLTIVG